MRFSSAATAACLAFAYPHRDPRRAIRPTGVGAGKGKVFGVGRPGGWRGRIKMKMLYHRTINVLLPGGGEGKVAGHGLFGVDHCSGSHTGMHFPDATGRREEREGVQSNAMPLHTEPEHVAC